MRGGRDSEEEGAELEKGRPLGSHPTFVAAGCPKLLHFARRLLGQRLFDKLMKMTFYGQFVAGEDQESIRPLIRHNKLFGVGSILDYGVEEDLSAEGSERQELESCTSEAERKGGGTSKREKQYQAHQAFGDRRDGVISARTYFYANESKCDSHMETFLRCIEASVAVLRRADQVEAVLSPNGCRAGEGRAGCHGHKAGGGGAAGKRGKDGHCVQEGD